MGVYEVLGVALFVPGLVSHELDVIQLREVPEEVQELSEGPLGPTQVTDRRVGEKRPKYFSCPAWNLEK